VGFAEFVAGKDAAGGVCDVDAVEGTVDVVQFYRADVATEAGVGEVRAGRMGEAGRMTRFYAGCCGTVLGLVPRVENVPIMMLNRGIVEGAGALPEARVVVGWRDAREGSVKPAGMRCCDSVMDGRLVGRVVAIVVLGLLLGKGKSGPEGFEPCPGKDGGLEIVDVGERIMR